MSVIQHVKTFLISIHLSTTCYLLYLLVSFYLPLFLVEIKGALVLSAMIPSLLLYFLSVLLNNFALSLFLLR